MPFRHIVEFSDFLRGNAVVEDRGDRYRDTLVLTVRGDGVDVPPFFIVGQYGNAPRSSGRRPSPGEKPVRGMNNTLIRKYIDHVAPYLSEPTLLLWDRHSSHTSKETFRYIKRWRTSDGRQLIIPIALDPRPPSSSVH